MTFLATKEKTIRKHTSTDPITQYAKKVVTGKIIAGPHVRGACQRHLDDLENGFKRGLVWDVLAANRALGFFSDVLKFSGGGYEGLPFVLLPWQTFIVGSLFGWKTADGYRRYRTGYIETGKGSGKSPIAAGIGLYGMMSDGEAGAEIYAAATKKDQAMILFRDAVSMVDTSPDLRKRIKKSGRGLTVWSLAWMEKRSFFRPISSDDGQSGPRPHIALLDEIHEHKDAYVVEMLKAGQKSRRQPMLVGITNSGTNKNSVCWDYHDYGAKVCSRQIEDDSFFAYICAMDINDDPFKSEKCWHKANPSLKHGLPTLKYLREQVHQARGMPSKESIVRRLNFCEWVESQNPWIGSEVWFSCEDQDFDVSLLHGRKCYGGLDLSSTQDLTSFVLIFEPTPEDQFWRLQCWFWLPGDGLNDKADKDRVPYNVWKNENYLLTTEGKAVNRLAVVRTMAEACSSYDIQAIAYDRWRIEDLKVMLDTEGISLPLVPFGQGFKDMAPAVDEFESKLLSGNIKHSGNPVMTWCAANAVVSTDPAGNRKVTKEKATGRVDGIVAALMAIGVINKDSADGPSVYEDRGVLTL